MWKSIARTAIAVILVGAAAPGAFPQQAITIESLTRIKHPLFATWSPDGSRIAYVWDEAGVQNVHLVSPDGSAARKLTDFDSPHVDGRWLEDGPIGDLFWGPQGDLIYFVRAGELWSVPASGRVGAERAWPNAAPAGGYALSPDGAQMAFVRDGDIQVRPLAGGAERRLAQTHDGEGSLAWSPDGDRIAFTANPPSQRVMETPDYNGDKLHFSRVRRTDASVGVIRVADGVVWTPAGGRGNEARPRWAGPDRVVFERVTPDLATREVAAADVSDRTVEILDRDPGGEWWSLTHVDAGPHPSPDGEWVAFLSDRDGWDHLYVVPAAGGDPVQITSGEFEVRDVSWSPAGDRIAFDTNRGENPGVRQLEVATLQEGPAAAEVMSLTTGRGTHTSPAWSPDGSRLLFQRTAPEHPADLFVVMANGRDRRRLTTSLPPELRGVDFVEPRFVTYPAPDGRRVPGYLFTPDGAEEGSPRPAIVWIHGDGVNQNYDGWHVEREYSVYSSVHQYLLQQGYVVLAVDYRGSIGYGREWREGHYRDLGGKDYRDVAAGMDYLEGLGYVDMDRVGVWGLSYGGFMTLQALTVTPELFACGIDVAGVVDWRDWYRDPGGRWIHGRLGAPSASPELYDRTAPIHRVDRITRPTAVLHGTADVNVPFIESVRLVDEMQKQGIPVDFELYPGEFHYFQRAHVLRAAWERVDEFFASCLAPPGR